MKVQDEYRIQTEESVAWRNEFQAQKSSLFSSPQVIDTDREERLKQQYSANTKGLSVLHGSAKVPRDAQVYHGSGSPEDHKNKLYIWLRNGWTTDENSVKVDARQLGNESPLITVYLPKRMPMPFIAILSNSRLPKTRCGLKELPLPLKAWKPVPPSKLSKTAPNSG